MKGISIAKRLRQFIESHDSKCGVGATESRIQDFECQNHVRIPDDLRTYFTELNGTAGDYAYGIIRFWSIDESCPVTHDILVKRAHQALIQSSYREPIEGGENFFVFADCLHESQLYAIYLSSSDKANPVVLLDGERPTVVAESFSDFIERYLTTPEDLRLVLD
jgi:hypothetical protein